MAVADLLDWLDEQARPGVVWVLKRLSANDTQETGGHQNGPFIPKTIIFSLFPSINRPEAVNPDHVFQLCIDSHPAVKEVRAVWYNQKTRNEARLTRFGGTVLLNAESTGSLAVFAFETGGDGIATRCNVWVCDHAIEEDLIEERVGPVEPERPAVWSVDGAQEFDLFGEPRIASCWLAPDLIPPAWLERFPTGAEIIEQAVALRPDLNLDPDRRLLRRRDCEFEVFRSLEEAVELPLIRRGFETIDDFIARAQTILQRRKSRSGRSLELHARKIFQEEGFRETVDFSHQPESDPGKKPDFLFPSEQSYKDKAFPADRLRMLAAKTTCKDRWRQILNEAERIPVKHLLTLQEGVSEKQFREMTEAGVRLVVPLRLHDSYPQPVRAHLVTLESFIGDVRLITGAASPA